jgi:hypothetical protein
MGHAVLRLLSAAPARASRASGSAVARCTKPVQSTGIFRPACRLPLWTSTPLPSAQTPYQDLCHAAKLCERRSAHDAGVCVYSVSPLGHHEAPHGQRPWGLVVPALRERRPAPAWPEGVSVRRESSRAIPLPRRRGCTPLPPGRDGQSRAQVHDRPQATGDGLPALNRR